MIINLNIDPILKQFVIKMLDSGYPIEIRKDSYFGNTFYRLLQQVPEDCKYIERLRPKKEIISFTIGEMGTKGEERKTLSSHYYFPTSAQREFEMTVCALFDELFFQVICVAREYTDQQYVVLIESFCLRYGIDFTRHFESLKKKHYRARMRNVKNENNYMDACPLNL